MTIETLAAALEREHREIDLGIETFLAAGPEAQSRTEQLVRVIDSLRRHIFLEEEFLFPPLREAGLIAPVFVMLREHGEIWDALDELDARLKAEGAGAGTFDICTRLLAQLERHNSKEEPILYPQADTALSADARSRLNAFLASGQMPPGWVCAHAGRELDSGR